MNHFIFKSFLGFFLVGFCFTSNAQCSISNMQFTTQEDIDNFSVNSPDCFDFDGNILVEESVSGSIVNLNGLSQLNSISGTLRIKNNQLLNSLAGLEGLTSVGLLIMTNNDNLIDFTGLENLTEINNSFQFLDNANLINANGLENLTNVGGIFVIENNANFVSTLGMSSLTEIGGGVRIIGNPSFVSPDGLSSLLSIGPSFVVTNNESMINFLGLESLTLINGSIEMYSNDSFVNFEGLESLETIEGDFYLTNSPSLVDFTGLSNLTQINGGFSIGGNSTLNSFSGLEAISEINGYLSITGHPYLTSIDAFQNINPNILFDIYINNNPLLSQCAIQSICTYLEIPNSTAFMGNNSTGCNSRLEVENACVLSIEEAPLSEVKIFPNPAMNEFHVVGITEGQIELIDIAGRSIDYIKFTNQAISLSGLSEGVYFVKISSEGKTTTRQISKK